MVKSKELLNAVVQETIAFLFSKDRAVGKKPQINQPALSCQSVFLSLFCHSRLRIVLSYSPIHWAQDLKRLKVWVQEPVLHPLTQCFIKEPPGSRGGLLGASFILRPPDGSRETGSERQHRRCRSWWRAGVYQGRVQQSDAVFGLTPSIHPSISAPPGLPTSLITSSLC